MLPYIVLYYVILIWKRESLYQRLTIKKFKSIYLLSYLLFIFKILKAHIHLVLFRKSLEILQRNNRSMKMIKSKAATEEFF